MNKRKRPISKAVPLVFGMVLVLSLSLVGQMTAQANEPVVLRFAATSSATSSSQSKAVPWFIQQVEAASDGTLKIEHYPGGSLGGAKGQLKLLEDGVVDFAEVVPAYTPGRFPDVGVMNLPFTSSSPLEGSLVLQRLHDQELLQGFEKIIPVAFYASGPARLHARFPLTSLDKVNGKKFRTAGPTQAKMMSALGVVPVGNLSITEVPEALSRGIVEGLPTTASSLFVFRLDEVTTSHVMNVPLGSIPVIYAMNRAKYESLPEKARAALDRYIGEPFTRKLATVVQADNTAKVQLLIDSSEHEVIEWPDSQIEEMRAAMSEVKADWDQPNTQGVNLWQSVQDALADLRSKAE